MENRIIKLSPKLLGVHQKKTATDAEHISKLRASQSPIAISVSRCPTWSSLDILRFTGYWDNQANGILLNNGSTAYFAFETPVRPTLRGGPLIGEYIFEQMHFHWSVDAFTGCEHVLDGQGVHTLKGDLEGQGWCDDRSISFIVVRVNFRSQAEPKKDKRRTMPSVVSRLTNSCRIPAFPYIMSYQHDEPRPLQFEKYFERYAAECHFVHYNSKYESLETAVGHPDGLAVVGFLFETVDAPNPRFDKLVEGLARIKKKDSSVHVTSESLSWMNTTDLQEGNYLTYKGSLTTPPYTECVTWIIYEKPVAIGFEQLGLLRELEGPEDVPIERNVRPTQRHPPGHSVIYVKQVQGKSKL